MNRTKRVLLGVMVVGAIGSVVSALSFGVIAGVLSPAPEVPPSLRVQGVAPEYSLNLSFKRGDTLEHLLERAGLDRASQVDMIEAVESSFDVKKFRAGKKLTLNGTLEGEFQSIEYIIDPDHKLQLSNDGGDYDAAVVEIPGVISEVPVCGVLEDSLFLSMERTGEQAELAIRMADIFAWDIDFYTDPRKGDEFCLLVEKKEYINGQTPTYRRILAAQYKNSGELYDAYLFPDKDGKPRYFASSGKSLQSAFLRSPLKFNARVSSRFSHRRLHPVLKTYRPHLGTDYAAPTGTPVQAVGSGRVTFSGRSGGSGNLIKIRHTNGFETMYLHLSRRFVKKGQRVSQGQRIGAVGATGLATGPHLAFRLRKSGRYVDFERLKLPPAPRLTGGR
ncbi:MAG: M23 family metallopeptidase, partial [bacterium]|nr:M23 family metallopeptidase [bacterium]